MKKVKILKTRNNILDSQPLSQLQKSKDNNVDDLDNSINTEITRKKPIKITDSGFTSSTRKITNTDEGMESEVEEPMIMTVSGHRVKEQEIKGQCGVCGGFDSKIFNCHIYGCKKTLCLKHVYFFDPDDQKVPYCEPHYHQRVNEFDTWADNEKRRR